MGKYAVVVVGPAGAGKSTCCRVLGDHYSACGRSTHVCNFDPAAEDLAYEPSIDVRELICVEDAMETQQLGPNGGLVFCMEHLMQNAGWIHDQLEDYTDDFLIVDMPGQVELLTHIPVVPQFIELLRQAGYFVTALFLLDSLTATADAGKFVSGTLLTLTTMMTIDCPFVNVLSKCDLLSAEQRRDSVMEHYEQCHFDYLKMGSLPPRLRDMTRQISTIVHDFSLVRYLPLDITDTESIDTLTRVLNDTLQVADDDEVRDQADDEDREA
jgi:GTPase SAR1 family protein